MYFDARRARRARCAAAISAASNDFYLREIPFFQPDGVRLSACPFVPAFPILDLSESVIYSSREWPLLPFALQNSTQKCFSFAEEEEEEEEEEKRTPATVKRSREDQLNATTRRESIAKREIIIAFCEIRGTRSFGGEESDFLNISEKKVCGVAHSFGVWSPGASVAASFTMQYLDGTRKCSTLQLGVLIHHIASHIRTPEIC